MQSHQQPYTFDRVIRLAITCVIIYVLWQLISYLSDVLIPFAIATLLAYLINPLVNRYQKRITNRLLAILAALGTVFAAVFLFCAITKPMIVSELNEMGDILQHLVEDSELKERLDEFHPKIEEIVTDYAAQEDVQELLQSADLVTILQTALKRLVPGIMGIARGATSLIVGICGLLVILLYTIFLLLDYSLVQRDWKDLLPPSVKSGIIEFIGEFNQAMNRYFRGQATVAFLTGLLFSISFGIIGLPMGILLGLLIGVLNMVPYLQIIGAIPVVMFAIIKGLDPGSTIGVWGWVTMVAVIFVVVQAIQDAFLVPKIMGKATGLSPAIILLSISIWGKLLGFFGLIIALPMTCLVLAYYQRMLTNLSKQSSDEPAPDSS